MNYSAWGTRELIERIQELEGKLNKIKQIVSQSGDEQPKGECIHEIFGLL